MNQTHDGFLLVPAALEEVDNRTEVERLREELDAERLKNIGLARLVQCGVHDLGNFAFAMSSNQELARKALLQGDTQKAEACLKAAGDAASSLKGLLGEVGGLLASSEYVLSYVDPNEVVRRVEGQLRACLNGYEFDVQTCSKGIIKVNPLSLERILTDLVLNAKEAVEKTKERPNNKVSIRTEDVKLENPARYLNDSVPAGSYVKISVEDTGAGMNADQVAGLFYYRPRINGERVRGVGLSSVALMAKIHNAHIGVNTKLGEGSEFSVYFRVAKQENRVQ